MASRKYSNKIAARHKKICAMMNLGLHDISQNILIKNQKKITETEENMAQILMITGTGIFGLFGSMHLFYTFFTSRLDPYDLSVKEAMQGTSLALTRETTVWKAWVGFNASHSLGAMLVAAFYIPLALWNFTIIENSLWFTWLPVIMGLSYLFLAKKYWFKIPFVGIFIATICFIGAAVTI